MPVKAVGITWYRREDYDRLMGMFPDREKLPDTFDGWVSSVRQVYNSMILEGFIVEKVLLDPETFPDWCRTKGLKMDALARARYATEYTVKKHGAESTGADPGITPS